MNLIRRAWYRFRSSVTGRFVSRAVGLANPRETVREVAERKPEQPS